MEILKHSLNKLFDVGYNRSATNNIIFYNEYIEAHYKIILQWASIHPPQLSYYLQRIWPIAKKFKKSQLGYCIYVYVYCKILFKHVANVHIVHQCQLLNSQFPQDSCTYLNIVPTLIHTLARIDCGVGLFGFNTRHFMATK